MATAQQVKTMNNMDNPRVLLVTSSVEETTLEKKYEDINYVLEEVDSSHYPIGIASLHAYVESQGIGIRSLFLNAHGYRLCFEEVIKNIDEFKPGILGLQMLTQNRVSSYKLIEHIHKNYQHIKIVLGGIHASVMYEQLLKKYPQVTIVLGEGEITFVELIRAMEAGEEFDNIAGLAFSKNGEIVKTMQRPLIYNLDILPLPKHELFFGRERTCACIMTSRGCPFRCSFCALESISRRQHRTRSISNVMEEIEHLVKTFPKMNKIWIHDDTFFLNNERAIEFCDEVIKRKLKVEFIASGRIKPISEKLVQKLEEANFTMVLVGLESGTDEILLRAHKGITQKDVIETAKLFAKTKIELIAFLIVGLPGETTDTIYNTAKFIKKVQKIKYIPYDQISILLVYPGTEVYRLAKEGGMMDDDYWLSEKLTPMYTVEHSEEELIYFRKILLDHIAFKRIATWEGLKAQYDMLPYAAMYVSAKKNKIAKIAARVKALAGAHSQR